MKRETKTKKQLIDELEKRDRQIARFREEGNGNVSPERVYELFFNFSNDLLCIAGLDGYFKLLNPAFEKTLGYTSEELCARPYHEFIHPEDRAETCETKADMHNGTSGVCCEARYLCKDGSYKRFSWTEYKDVDEGLIYAVARDITTQRQAEEALQKARDELELRVQERTGELLKINKKLMEEIDERKKIEGALQESEERYRILFEESPIALWEKDFSEIKKHIDDLKNSGIRDFRTYFQNHQETVAPLADMMKIVDANKTMVELYKAESKEKFLNDIIKVFHDETYDLFRGELLAIAEGKLIHESEGITQKFTGEKNHIAIRWTVPPGYKETFSKVLVSVIDITARDHMEKEARLLQLKLIHANKMTALGTLVSGIAHEINNPNSFIMSNADMISDILKELYEIIPESYLKERTLPSGRPSYTEMHEVLPKLLKGIYDGSLRIKSIIDNLRDLARPDRSGMDERVDINRAVMASRMILSNQIKKCTDNFSERYRKDIPAVKGNTQQIEQVIINLLMNSLQALPGRGCGVTVSTSFSKKSARVIIKVKDEGVGMSGDIYERIREPFFTTKFDSGGTGLGLSISYDIIKKHKGTLEFESTPGAGTTAKVGLPVYHE